MKKTIKSTNLTITSTISEYLDEKVKSIERLIDPNDSSAFCRVELEKTTDHHQAGKVYRAEFTISTGAGVVRVESTEESIEAAIDEAKDEAVKQLRRRKDKRFHIIKRGGRAVKDWLQGFRKEN